MDELQNALRDSCPIIKNGKKIIMDNNYLPIGAIIECGDGVTYIKRSFGDWREHTKDYWDDANHYGCDNFPNCDSEGCGMDENVGHRG